MSTVSNKYQKIISKHFKITYNNKAFKLRTEFKVFKDLYKANVRYVSLTKSTWALSRYPVFDFSLKRIYVT